MPLRDVSEGLSSRILDANGQQIHVVERGAGPLVLLLHGFPETWYSWRHQLVTLSEAGFRVAAMDMRGYGRSSKPATADEYRITELVADAVGVVHALGEDAAVVVGHDWGAAVAWTAAWTRPDVFRAVAGLSVPFAGRGLVALPGSPFGELRPSLAERALAGDGLLFYQEYFSLPGVAEDEMERDVRGWLRAGLYSLSASPPLPPVLEGVDLAALPDAALVAVLRQTPLCMEPGTEMRDRMTEPDELPDWLTDVDLDVFTAEFERTGFNGPLSYYRCLDVDWELLAGFDGCPLSVPALYIGGDRDVVTLWGRDAIAGMGDAVADSRGIVVLESCGHWIQQEQPEQTSAALLRFLGEL